MANENANAPKEVVRINFSSKEIHVETSDREFLESMLDRYQRLWQQERAACSSAIAESSASGLEKKQSIVEFVRQIKPNTGTEYVIAAGYFLERESSAGFYSSDIKDAFLDLKFSHSNPSDAIAKAKKRGWLMEGKDPGEYVLTRSGEEWITERINT